MTIFLTFHNRFMMLVHMEVHSKYHILMMDCIQNWRGVILKIEPMTFTLNFHAILSELFGMISSVVIIIIKSKLFFKSAAIRFNNYFATKYLQSL